MPVLRPKVNIGKYKAAVFVICDRHGRSKQNSAVHLDASRRKTELSCPRVSGVNPALPDRVSNSINRQHIGRNAVVHAMSFRVTNNIFERRLHNVLKLFIHDRFFPEISLSILNPFEV